MWTVPLSALLPLWHTVCALFPNGTIKGHPKRVARLHSPGTAAGTVQEDGDSGQLAPGKPKRLTRLTETLSRPCVCSCQLPFSLSLSLSLPAPVRFCVPLAVYSRSALSIFLSLPFFLSIHHLAATMVGRRQRMRLHSSLSRIGEGARAWSLLHTLADAVM